MKKSFSRIFAGVLCAHLLVIAALANPAEIRIVGNGQLIGNTAAELIGFHGATPIAQRAAAAQAALTDSTGGSTADATLASTVGVQTLSIPIQLASMTTGAADLITSYTPGFKFKILSASFATTTLGTGSGASQTLSLAISGTAVTGGVVVPTLSSTDTLGKLTAGSSVTALNTGSASATLSLKVAASGTVFTAGAGVLLVTVQNMDTADAFAKSAVLSNEVRAALVAKGLIKGSL